MFGKSSEFFFRPRGHLCICSDCSNSSHSERITYRCPECRQQIHELMQSKALANLILYKKGGRPQRCSVIHNNILWWCARH